MQTGTFTNWRKSSRSGGGDNCVEVATAGRVVGVRDSKNPTGPILQFDHAEWNAFLNDIRDGHFDNLI